MATKVKLITTNAGVYLENKINKWLEKAGNITVITINYNYIKFSKGADALIVYKEEETSNE